MPPNPEECDSADEFFKWFDREVIAANWVTEPEYMEHILPRLGLENMWNVETNRRLIRSYVKLRRARKK